MDPREICEQIYNDYREASHFDHVALMMLAYRKGREQGLNEASELARRPVKREPTVMDLCADLMQQVEDYESIGKDRRPRSAVVSNSNGYVMTGDEPR